MTKILFICWGNICRSPAAELLFRDMARREGREKDFLVDSAGVSDEEEGSGVYPPMRKLLEARGIDCSEKRARKLRAGEAEDFDLLVCMDELTIERTRRLVGPGQQSKIRNLLDYTGEIGAGIDDPWYTREFHRALYEIEKGCRAMLDALDETVILDLSACSSREALYAELRGKMGWEDWYGENLDALWDVLTGLPHRKGSFRLRMPPEDSPLRAYAERVRETFREAGVLEEE